MLRNRPTFGTVSLLGKRDFFSPGLSRRNFLWQAAAHHDLSAQSVAGQRTGAERGLQQRQPEAGERPRPRWRRPEHQAAATSSPPWPKRCPKWRCGYLWGTGPPARAYALPFTPKAVYSAPSTAAPCGSPGLGQRHHLYPTAAWPSLAKTPWTWRGGHDVVRHPDWRLHGLLDSYYEQRVHDTPPPTCPAPGNLRLRGHRLRIFVH